MRRGDLEYDRSPSLYLYSALPFLSLLCVSPCRLERSFCFVLFCFVLFLQAVDACLTMTRASFVHTVCAIAVDFVIMENGLLTTLGSALVSRLLLGREGQNTKDPHRFPSRSILSQLFLTNGMFIRSNVFPADVWLWR